MKAFKEESFHQDTPESHFCLLLGMNLFQNILGEEGLAFSRRSKVKVPSLNEFWCKHSFSTFFPAMVVAEPNLLGAYVIIFI